MILGFSRILERILRFIDLQFAFLCYLLLCFRNSSKVPLSRMRKTSEVSALCYCHSRLAPFIPALAGSGGQIVSCLMTSPIDRFRTQYWADRHQKVSSLLRKSINQAKTEGFLCLYHGLKPLLIRDILFTSIYWTLYENLRSALGSFGVSPILQNLIAGSIGGMITSASITPIDLVKTRQQVLQTKESIWTTLKYVGKEEGVRGLFRGLTPRVAQTMMTMSVMMTVYDGLNRFILRYQNDLK